MTNTLPHNQTTYLYNEATDINAVSKLDPLIEELQIVRLEGRYFCFDRHEEKNRVGVLDILPCLKAADSYCAKHELPHE